MPGVLWLSQSVSRLWVWQTVVLSFRTEAAWQIHRRNGKKGRRRKGCGASTPASLHQKFHREYEQRKQAIGRIVCPQCKWSGNWGDGMSYQEFFVYELFSNNVIPTEEIDLNIHYMNTQAQTNTMCQSTNWQKV